MAFLTRDDFLALVGSRAWEPVFIGLLDKRCVVVGMTGKERDAFESGLVSGPKRRLVNTDNVRAKLAARCLYDLPPGEGGTRLFTDEEADLLGELRVDVLSPIFAVAQRLCGVTNEDVDELGKVAQR